MVGLTDSCGHVKFWGRGCDKGIQSLQKFSAGSGGWRCYQTLKIPLSMHKRVPEEAKDFTRASSAPTSGVWGFKKTNKNKQQGNRISPKQKICQSRLLVATFCGFNPPKSVVKNHPW